MNYKYKATEGQEGLFEREHRLNVCLPKPPITVWRRRRWETTGRDANTGLPAGVVPVREGGRGIPRYPDRRRLGFVDTFSTFSMELAEAILAAYCPIEFIAEPTAPVRIFDPFSGFGQRRRAAEEFGTEVPSGVEYVGFDLFNGQDSMVMKPDGLFDFSYTCPPYWNLETYQNLPNDLSNVPTYKDFLGGIEKVLKNTYDVLKSEAFCVWVVGNFRNEEKGLPQIEADELLHFNGDLVRMAKNMGFSYWQEIIWWNAPNMAELRIGQFAKNLKAVPVHEYVEVFKKL